MQEANIIDRIHYLCRETQTQKNTQFCARFLPDSSILPLGWCDDKEREQFCYFGFCSSVFAVLPGMPAWTS